MRHLHAGPRSFTLSAAVAAVLAAAAPATSTAATITGKVSGGRGYTVNATHGNGETVSKRLGSKGAFKLKLKDSRARGTTLHLIAPNGRYHGPVVLAHRGRTAFITLSGRSAALGTIRLRRGYSTLARRISPAAVGADRTRADKRGRPLGAGSLGLIPGATNSQVRKAAGPDDREPGGDLDRDGVVSAYDADDDGDLVLDSVDTGSASSSAGLFSTLFLGFTEALNANAGATREQIDDVIAGENRFNLVFYFDAARVPTARFAHVDCFGLAYCRPGDGSAILGGVSESSPDLPRGGRWVDYRPDGSRYPNLERIDRNGSAGFVAGVQPRVPSTAISPGDTYNVVFSGGTAPITVPTSLAVYFVTTPAIASYSTGGAATELSYPIAQGSPGCCRRGQGSPEGNPVVMESERLTVTLWRPQRAAVPGAEDGAFTDMGRLRYGVVPNVEGASREISCVGHYSDLSPTLTAEAAAGAEQGPQLFPLLDSAGDAAPDRARTISFTVDLGACLRAAGMPSAGQTVDLSVTAATAPRPGGQDRAAQNFAVRLPG